MSHRTLLRLCIGTGIMASAALLALTCPPSSSAPVEPGPRPTPDPVVRTAALPQVTALDSAAPAPVAPDATWASDRVMVQPVDGDLQAVARAMGVEVLREPGRSGLGALSVPEGSTPSEFLAALRHRDLIESGAPMGNTVGAGHPVIEALQFGHVASQVPTTVPAGIGSVVVAVLDTGVAYETHTDPDGSHYVQAPTLVGSAITAPYDFINDDTHANDDHMHGTHIASIIASSGMIDGVAPGVGLMPVKVLDQNNQGTELALIEGLYHAADNGADVINMSLAFGADYAPSRALQLAIDHARDQGAVLVAAAGNGSLNEVAWPAASPAVIAVGAYCMTGPRSVAVASYSNQGPALDVSGPGGCMTLDAWGADGIPDGVVGETHAPGDPEDIGYWLMSGTSQAAAHVSGAAARMVAVGAHVERADRFLHATSPQVAGHNGFNAGEGSGILRIANAVGLAETDFDRRVMREGNAALSLMPYLVDNGDGTVTPTALVTGIDHKGRRLRKVDIHGQLYGAGGGPVTCTMKKSRPGTCTLEGEPVAATDAQGQPEALAWRFTVRAVVVGDDLAFRPSSMFFASDTLEAITGELQDDDTLASAPLAFHWLDETVADLGDVAEAYSIVDFGAGLSTSPFGVLLTPPAVVPSATIESKMLAGSGLTTSPFGFQLITIPPHSKLDGTGISTSPMGFSLVTLRASDVLDGAGLSTSPFGFKQIASPFRHDGGEECPDRCELFDQDPIILGKATIIETDALDFSGTALQSQLEGGGWQTPEGMGAATAIAGAHAEEVGPAVTGESTGAGGLELRLE